MKRPLQYALLFSVVLLNSSSSNIIAKKIAQFGSGSTADSIQPNIGIETAAREKLANMLNQLLSDEFTLYTKTLNMHWNIVGPFFGSLHGRLFQDQYEQLQSITDKVAERVRMLGYAAFGSLSEFLNNTSLREVPGRIIHEQEAIGMLLADHETIIRSLRPAIEAAMALGDAGTNNFLVEIIEKHEKMAWKLRAHLE